MFVRPSSRPVGYPAAALYEYVRLIVGPSSHLESVVDDLVIHLLTAVGFNDGNFLVLSKNKLKLSMNGDKNNEATPDVTVYDVYNNFRMAVVEVNHRPAQHSTAQHSTRHLSSLRFTLRLCCVLLCCFAVVCVAGQVGKGTNRGRTGS